MVRELSDVSAGVDRLADTWRAERGMRQARRHLELSDFEALRSTGLLETAVPAGEGGLWRSAADSARSVIEMLRRLARADPSVALVASMHPAVLSFWLFTEDGPAEWHEQRRSVFATALAGAQWGTITSEPGSGGDISRTRAVASPAPDLEPCVAGEAYRISGDKHFGSGSGVTSYMITTGLPEGSDEPAMFVLDVANRPWERDGGMSLMAEWDGMGMAATQSHAMRLDRMPATMVAAADRFDEVQRAPAPFLACLFTGVVLGVVDEAVETAREAITSRVDTLRPYEQVEWTRAEMDHWLAVQAYEGALRSLEDGDHPAAIHAGMRAKQVVAELAEATLLRLTRVLGGGTFSQRSPYSHWFEDVRALGFLRPPWGLSFDKLLATSLPPSDDAVSG